MVFFQARMEKAPNGGRRERPLSFFRNEEQIGNAAFENGKVIRQSYNAIQNHLNSLLCLKNGFSAQLTRKGIISLKLGIDFANFHRFPQNYR